MTDGLCRKPRACAVSPAGAVAVGLSRSVPGAGFPVLRLAGEVPVGRSGGEQGVDGRRGRIAGVREPGTNGVSCRCPRFGAWTVRWPGPHGRSPGVKRRCRCLERGRAWDCGRGSRRHTVTVRGRGAQAPGSSMRARRIWQHQRSAGCRPVRGSGECALGLEDRGSCRLHRRAGDPPGRARPDAARQPSATPCPRRRREYTAGGQAALRRINWPILAWACSSAF